MSPGAPDPARAMSRIAAALVKLEDALGELLKHAGSEDRRLAIYMDDRRRSLMGAWRILEKRLEERDGHARRS